MRRRLTQVAETQGPSRGDAEPHVSPSGLTESSNRSGGYVPILVEPFSVEPRMSLDPLLEMVGDDLPCKVDGDGLNPGCRVDPEEKHEPRNHLGHLVARRLYAREKLIQFVSSGTWSSTERVIQVFGCPF